MVELTKNDLFDLGRNSSKGNQFKWYKNGIWYKADYLGYEGLAEYVVSELLKKSNLEKDEVVQYKLETIKYGDQIFNGCKSRNFLQPGKNLFTLQRLYLQTRGQNLYQSVFKIEGIENRVRFLVNEIEMITGLSDYGVYLTKLLTVDAFFLNEDRHMHNIAVIADKDNNYELCPIFDNGACLLSDTAVEYPLGTGIRDLEKKVRPKTFCTDSFDDQLDAVEKLYGLNIRFSFTKKDVDEIMTGIPDSMYNAEIKRRVETVIFDQIDKYRYLF